MNTGKRKQPQALGEVISKDKRGLGNLLDRARELDKMDQASITKLNLGTGIPMIYKLNADSTVASKEVLGDMSGAH